MKFFSISKVPPATAYQTNQRTIGLFLCRQIFGSDIRVLDDLSSFFIRFFTLIMDTIPRKEMSKAKTYVLSSEVRSILCRKNDKWSLTTVYERVEQDLNILTKIC